MAKKDTDLVSALKEIRQLKRIIAKQQKEIGRLNGDIENFSFDAEDPAQNSPKSVVCPKCRNANLLEVITPSGKSRHFCRDCKWKGALNG